MSSHSSPGDPRTLLVAVLFADLVGYSRKSVADQVAAKESLRGLLQHLLASIPADERLILDTGDGAAIAFLADPEHALYFALRLRAMLADRTANLLLGPDDLRVGINLGPVKCVSDLNGHPNLVGEGMNSGERVMSFALPGETLVSRSFRDAVACLRGGYAALFESCGNRSDKHGREHEVFRVLASPEAMEAARASLKDVPVAPPEVVPSPGEDVQEAAPRAGHGRRVRPAAVLAIGLAVTTVVAGIAWLAGGRAPSAGVATPPAEVARSPAPPAEGGPAREAGRIVPPGPASQGADGASREPAEPGAARQAKTAPETSAPPAARAQTQRPIPVARPAGGTSARCAALMQRAALGDPLGPKDQEQLRTSCQ